MKADLLPYANVIIKLFQGIVYAEDREWNLLRYHIKELEKYFKGIGIGLIFDESEGYAFLKQLDFSEEESAPLRLVSKRQLTYSITILCVLLREKLTEFDNSTSETGRFLISKEDLIDSAKGFFPTDTSNEAKQIDKIQADINKLVEYGFLKWQNDKKTILEVKRILRAVFTADNLNEIKEKLIDYAKRIT